MIGPLPWITHEEAARRWPRLLNACQWVGILSTTEAACCLRDYFNARGHAPYLLRWGGGEAVAHYGGPLALVTQAASEGPRSVIHRRGTA